MVCPKCQAPNRALANRCQRCGAEFGDPAGSTTGIAPTPPSPSEAEPNPPTPGGTVLLATGPPRGAARDPVPGWRTVDWPRTRPMTRRAAHRRRRAYLAAILVSAAAVALIFGLTRWQASPAASPASVATPVPAESAVDPAVPATPAATAPAATATPVGVAAASPAAPVAPPGPAAVPEPVAPAGPTDIPGYQDLLGRIRSLDQAGDPLAAWELVRRHGGAVPPAVQEAWQEAGRGLADRAVAAAVARIESANRNQQRPEAAALLARVRALGLTDPGLSRWATQLGWEFWRQGDGDRLAGRLPAAVTAYRLSLQATTVDYYSDDVHFYLARVLQATGKCQEAVDHAGTILADYPLAWWYHDDALLLTAECQASVGDTDAARKTFAEVIRLYPDTHSAVISRTRLN